MMIQYKKILNYGHLKVVHGKDRKPFIEVQYKSERKVRQTLFSLKKIFSFLKIFSFFLPKKSHQWY